MFGTKGPFPNLRSREVQIPYISMYLQILDSRSLLSYSLELSFYLVLIDLISMLEVPELTLFLSLSAVVHIL
jgi:hypothetical protein